MKRTLSLATGLILLASTGSILAQGSLTPPGPPAPTMKTLDEVEPRIAINATNTPGSASAVFVISVPGSYYLTGNVTGVSGKSAITVTSPDVSIDLRGHKLTGVTGATAAISFVSQNRVTITNGSVINWPGGGLSGAGAVGARLENIIAESNQNTGIRVSWNAIVTACTARSNTPGTGIMVGDHSIVSRCVSVSNGLQGFVAVDATVITDCVALSNGSAGILLDGAAGRIAGCTASFNTGNGIECAGFGNLVEHCTARTNGGLGISLAGDSSVSFCVVTTNTGGGILASNGTHVFQNECNSHFSTATTTGISVTGFGCRVEGNVCRNNGRGYATSAGGATLVVRNLAQGNTTNYVLTGTAGAGPLVTAANVATNNSPHANFDF